MQSRKIVDRGQWPPRRSSLSAAALARDLYRRILGRRVPGRAARSLFQAVHGQVQDQDDRGKLGRRRRHAAREDPGRQQQLGRRPGRVRRAAASAARKGSTKSSTGRSSAARTSTCPDAVNDCGVGAIVYSFILAYDGDKIKSDPPKSWADFWNVQKWPGKRALRKGPKTTLEIALHGRRRRAEGRLQDARHQRRRRARVQEARPVQARTWCGGKRARSRRNCSPPAKWR